MKKQETKLYVPLEIEVVEVQIERGYAQSGDALEDFNEGGAAW